MAKGLGIHIGLNRVSPAHYGGWHGPLTACEADAEDMAALARAEGYSTELLLTAAATRKAVLASIGKAAATLASGDILLLTYSGHGGQVPDRNGEEADLRDETWCLYDGELIDDELTVAWSAFVAGVRIVVLSDSCHSGTVTRLAYDELARTGVLRRPVSRSADPFDPIYRTMPDDVALRTYRQNREFYRELAGSLPPAAPPVKCTVRLISGCQDNQLSQDGAFNGLFTGTLLRVWKNGAFRGNYRQFHRDIVGRMPPTQSPNHFVLGAPNKAFDEQRPFAV